jgi:hypothetical protein
LADLDIKNKVLLSVENQQKIGLNDIINYRQSRNYKIMQSYEWIETLLQTPIPDHRKYSIELVLAPYFVNVKCLLTIEAYRIIKEWVMKCNHIQRLEPSIEYVDNKIGATIDKSIQKGIPPIRKENIQNKYPDWYNDFIDWTIFD